jgi:uncharacterized membrane protein YtjA (UPF0391 family)
MLKWAFVYLVIAVFAAFGQMAPLDSATQAAAKVLCFGCLALFVLFVGLGGYSRRT